MNTFYLHHIKGKWQCDNTRIAISDNSWHTTGVSQGKISTTSLCNSRSEGPDGTRKRGVILQNDQTMKSLQSPAGKRLTENLPYPNLLRSLPQEYWPSLIKANEISATSKAADLLRSLSESEWECEPQRGVNASLSVSALLCADEAVITDWNKGTGRNFTIMDLLSTCAECIIPQNKNS